MFSGMNFQALHIIKFEVMLRYMYLNGLCIHAVMSEYMIHLEWPTCENQMLNPTNHISQINFET